MGNSCLEYKGKYKFINDFEIEVVALSVASYLKKNIMNKVPDFAIQWEVDFPQFANGAIDLQLDHFFPKKEDGEWFVKIVNETKDHLILNSDFITENKLKEFVSPEIKLAGGGIPAEKVKAYFDKFSSFVEDALAGS